jgi:hypothetical protein
MDVTTNTNRLAWGGWISLISTAVAALGTVGILYVYASQLGVMGQQLDVMQGTLQTMMDNQRFTQRPLLKIHLHEDPEKLSEAGYPKTEEGGERWQLPYFLLNIGGNPAWDIRYWHGLSEDSVIQMPDSSEFETRLANDLLLPNSFMGCGYDNLLRQAWIDKSKAGVAMYRHFIVSYRDEDDNYYVFHAAWLIQYEVGKPLRFPQISYEPVADAYR